MTQAGTFVTGMSLVTRRVTQNNYFEDLNFNLKIKYKKVFKLL